MADETKLAQGPARPATASEIAQDENTGYMYPNLHRRIDTDLTGTAEDCYITTEDGYRLTTEDGYLLLGAYFIPSPGAEDYNLLVGGVNSFRTTGYNTHDEESTTSEVP